MQAWDQKGLLIYIKSRYKLHWNGIHGASHWARVAYWGKVLAATKNVDPTVVRLFALLHDCERLNDGRDPEHGYRSADLLPYLRGKLFDLSDKQFGQLSDAIRFHTDGLTSKNPVIQTCWDSDRLDLYRVGIMPSKPFISEEAYDLVEDAIEFSFKTRRF